MIDGRAGHGHTVGNRLTGSGSTGLQLLIKEIGNKLTQVAEHINCVHLYVINQAVANI